MMRGRNLIYTLVSMPCCVLSIRYNHASVMDRDHIISIRNQNQISNNHGHQAASQTLRPDYQQSYRNQRHGQALLSATSTSTDIYQSNSNAPTIKKHQSNSVMKNLGLNIAAVQDRDMQQLATQSQTHIGPSNSDQAMALFKTNGEGNRNFLHAATESFDAIDRKLEIIKENLETDSTTEELTKSLGNLASTHNINRCSANSTMKDDKSGQDQTPRMHSCLPKRVRLQNDEANDIVEILADALV